jgi:hypothetical protein
MAIYELSKVETNRDVLRSVGMETVLRNALESCHEHKHSSNNNTTPTTSILLPTPEADDDDHPPTPNGTPNQVPADLDRLIPTLNLNPLTTAVLAPSCATLTVNGVSDVPIPNHEVSTEPSPYPVTSSTPRTDVYNSGTCEKVLLHRLAQRALRLLEVVDDK